jgi:dipeptidyl aminopeptidase/acylaminoacyl peptidase
MITALRSSFVCIAVLAATDLARAGDVLTPHRVAELRSVTSAATSPDGKHVAYTIAAPRKPFVDDDGAPWTELWVLDTESGAVRPFVTGKNDLSNVAWTPDGSALAFLTKRGDDQNTALYLLPFAGGEATRAASLETAIASFSLSPDGKRAALVAPPAEDAARKKEQEKGFKQEIYEEDWKPNRVWIATLFDGQAKPAALAIDGSVTQVKWSPVDDRLLIAKSPTSLVDDEMMKSRVSIVDAASGKELARFDNPGKLGAMAWSADGARIAMQSAADVHDPSAGRLMIASSSGRALVDPLPNYAGDVAAFAWADATHVMYVASQGVWTVFEKIDVTSGEGAKTILPAGGAILSSVSLSKDGQHAAFVAHTPQHPPEVYTMSHGDAGPKRATHCNPWLDSLRLAQQELVKFKARDGLELEGLLVRPLDETKGSRYPLILYVHGGPESHHQNGWLTSYGDPAQVAAAEGFAVFHVNYRGSTGRGVAFAKLSQGDPAGAEFDDLVDGVDALIASGLVDASKVGVTGGSYGGYATGWLSTAYSQRFAAGVMFVGISDKLSKVGTTDIAEEEFLVHALHRPWDAWEFLLTRSPIWYAGKSTTPLLILGGKDDPRVDPGQSRELYRHLKVHGNAPVRLVRYPGEQHGNRKACARLDYTLRCMEWFEHYLKGPGGAPPKWDLDHHEAQAADKLEASASR